MPITTNELVETFRSTTEKLTALIESFDNETFNSKPENGGWSAGEVAEHLLIFDQRLTLILDSAIYPTERDILEQVNIFTPRVTDRNNKIEAPPFLIPTPGIKSPEKLAELIRSERDDIIQKIKQKDLTLHSKEYPHRFYGEMTSMEWITLIDLHAKRHMEQLGELKARDKE